MAIRFIFEHDVVVDERPRRTFTLLPGKGVKGDKGDPGNGLTVKDVFDTLAELEAAYPTGNEYAYQVIDEDREIFIWSANEGAWTSLGALEGPAGPQGKGISSYVEYYARSTSGTTAPADSAFSTTPPELTSTYKFMWSYALITLSDSTTITTTKHVVGAYGDKGDTGETGATGQTGATGATGKGISSYTEYYARGTSATTAPADADFSTTPPELTSTYKFMWAYTVITYSDNTSLTTVKHLIGVYGDKGDTGATGSTGATGATGPQGKGISSYTEYYARSSSGTTAPADADFSTTPPELTSTYKYMWVYTVITYSDNTTTTTAKHLVGAYGDTGSSGASTWGSITGTLSSQTDLQNALNAKADTSTTYTKTQVDTALGNKANTSDVYTKAQSAAVELFNDTVTLNSGTYNLSEDARNFMYIVIEALTNEQLQYNIIPYSALDSSKYINFSIFASASTGLISSWNYMARCDLKFASDFKSFSCIGSYTNVNFQIKPTKIWGVFRRAT